MSVKPSCQRRREIKKFASNGLKDRVIEDGYLPTCSDLIFVSFVYMFKFCPIPIILHLPCHDYAVLLVPACVRGVLL